MECSSHLLGSSCRLSLSSGAYTVLIIARSMFVASVPTQQGDSDHVAVSLRFERLALDSRKQCIPVEPSCDVVARQGAYLPVRIVGPQCLVTCAHNVRCVLPALEHSVQIKRRIVGIAGRVCRSRGAIAKFHGLEFLNVGCCKVFRAFAGVHRDGMC
jgi:hypothetical protein